MQCLKCEEDKIDPAHGHSVEGLNAVKRVLGNGETVVSLPDLARGLDETASHMVGLGIDIEPLGQIC